MKSYWVYMLRCADGSFYVGVTSELDRRIAMHNLGVNPNAYTHSRRPVCLVFSQEFSRPDEAIAAEKQIKGWSRAKKIALIAGDWNEIRRLSNHHRSTRLTLRQGSPFDKLTLRQAHPSTGSG